MKITQYLLIVLCMTIYVNLEAGVNLKNGNFYISYDDINFKNSRGGLESINRTYNSKSSEIGTFGYGWGVKIDTKIGIYPDGNILLMEHGGGGKSIFESNLYHEAMVSEMIDQLIEVLISNGELKNNPSEIIEQRRKFSNPEVRYNSWNKKVIEGKLKFVNDFPDGLTWSSNTRGYEVISKVNGSYIRKNNSEEDYFNSDGNLIKIQKRNGDYTDLIYENGILSKIVNANGSELIFKFNESGQVVEIDSEFGRSSYEYEDNRLVKSVDAEENIYAYEYDRMVNMIRIGYSDGSAMVISYHPKTYFTRSVTDRLGETTYYDYVEFFKDDGSVNDDHYATKVTRVSPYGGEVNNYYEYLIATRANGVRFSKMIITEVSGERTETIYDDFCGNTEEVTRNGVKTSFTYDSNCRMTSSVTSQGAYSYMKYHPEHGKMIELERNDETNYYEYDKHGNLTKAYNSLGISVILEYGERDKITKIIQDEDILHFKYNELGKPDTITIEGRGSIFVEYNDMGEVLRVRSENDDFNLSLKMSQVISVLTNLTSVAGLRIDI